MPYQFFDSHASEYDAWYDTDAGKAIFTMEADSLKPLLRSYPRPYLEIGVGSGRFAQALEIEYGVEPASTMAYLAKARGIKVTQANGEELPFPNETFGGLLIAFTLCFLDNPQKALQEACRVLVPEGGLALGLILKRSPWAEFYAEKGKEGHPIYSQARFYSKDEVENLLRLSGFKEFQYRSILFQPPGQNIYHTEKPTEGYFKNAGFSVIGSRKR